MLEGPADRKAPLSLAEIVVTHVGMRRGVVGRRGPRIEGHDVVGTNVRQLVPVQRDLEAAEIDAFEHDWVSREPQRSLLEIELDLGELGVKGQEVGEDLAWWLRAGGAG